MRILFVLAVVCSALHGVETQAESVPTQSEQNVDFGRLWLGGSLGALVGGGGGALGIYIVCINTTNTGGMLGRTGCLVASILLGYTTGVPLGATVGVSISGARQKMRSNIWLAAFGATLGGASALVLSQLLGNLILNRPGWEGLQEIFVPFFLFIGIPVSAGWGAAWGYSIGAKRIGTP